ncbi:hypothetical protein Rhein_3983 [Rheinheimera sp. A13L]|uniref:hypothetical protein n=1 Tax=Rheinheimera sp. A13L TaxID=506534 RepID=UPI0002124F4B|nr:hypothetical protein [Rheinheimera sp. A13L]EGM75991.1 hypothetical protein Rhein_3983 [Rheinheimera sp. A13L]
MSHYTKGLIVGTLAASLVTVLITTYLFMHSLRAAVIQEVAAQVQMSNIATQSTRLDQVRSMQLWKASCAIEHVEFMESALFSLISNKEDVNRLKSELRGAPQPCNHYPIDKENKL